MSSNTKTVLRCWSDDQQDRALKQGWGIFDNSDHGLRIERYDDADKFESDAAAGAFVAWRALKRDPLAFSAVQTLAFWYDVDGE